MKTKLAILLSIIASIQCTTIFVDLHNPEQLFIDALNYQDRVTALQEDIVDTITGLRLQLSGILKKSSNLTLLQIQDNIQDIFKLDEPVRKLIFVDNQRNTECLLNLRNQLNMNTEFSGYGSSNCLSRYNNKVDALLSGAYGTLAEYEGLISIVQLLVVKSFNGINIWSDPEAIAEKFHTEYDNQASKWQTTKSSISNFLSTLESDIAANNNILKSCFNDIQASLVPQYNFITKGLEVCQEFDN